MLKAKLLSNYLYDNDTYNKWFDGIVKKEVEWWVKQFDEKKDSPTETDLKSIKDILEKKNNKELTDDEVMKCHNTFFTLGSLAVKLGMKKYWEEKREKTVKGWKKDARLKNKRILSIVPFDNVKCPICHTVMIYQWSDLHEESIKIISKVMLFYRCPNKCKNLLIFEDGTPWINTDDDSCAICKGKRNSTVTKDNKGNTYVIFECLQCGSRQVESINS